MIEVQSPHSGPIPLPLLWVCYFGQNSRALRVKPPVLFLMHLWYICTVVYKWIIFIGMRSDDHDATADQAVR